MYKVSKLNLFFFQKTLPCQIHKEWYIATSIYLKLTIVIKLTVLYMNMREVIIKIKKYFADVI